MTLPPVVRVGETYSLPKTVSYTARLRSELSIRTRLEVISQFTPNMAFTPDAFPLCIALHCSDARPGTHRSQCERTLRLAKATGISKPSQNARQASATARNYVTTYK